MRLLNLTLDTKGEGPIAAVAIDGDILEEGTGTACGVEGDSDLPFTPWSDRLLAVLRRRASARRSDARDHQGSVSDILDDEGM